MRLIIVCSIWITLVVSLWAQTSNFKTHNLSSALPGAQGKVLFKDRAGKMWIGTNQGLLEFNGFEFRHITRPDTGIKEVTAIYEDLYRRLWIGYADGAVFNYTISGLKLWSPEEGLPRAPIRAFMEDFQRQLWIATYGEGLYVFDGRRIYNLDEKDDGLTGDDVYTMTRDHQGRIWAGTDHGISICTFENNQKKVETLGVKDGLPDQIVRSLHADAQGNIWIGTYDQGVIRYKITEKKFDLPLIPNWDHGVVSAIELMEGKELWIGTEDAGLWRYSLLWHELKKITETPGLINAKITALKKDHEGNLWVLNNQENIFLCQRQFDYLPTPGLEVQALLSNQFNRIYIGTPNGLYAHSRRDTIWQLVHSTQGLNILALYEDQYGTLWIGTFGQGLLWLNPENGAKKWFTEKEGLANNAVLSITGAGGQIWLATLGGITALHLSQPVFRINPELQHVNQLKKFSNYVYHVRSDESERTWFGTDGYGAYYWQDGKMQPLTFLTGVLDSIQQKDLKSVFSITSGSDSSLWLNGGQTIYRLKGNYLKKIYASPTRQLITSIHAIDKENILAIENGKILIINANNGIFTRYDQGQGRIKAEGNLNCIHSDGSPNVYIGTADQLILYSSLRENITRQPKTIIDRITVQGIPVDLRDPIQLKPQQNQITISYSGVWYNNPAEVLYKYRLKGYDPDWRVSRDHEAGYANLLPGPYTFELMSAVDGQWSANIMATIQIHIAKPLWQKLWFIILTLVSLISLVLYVIKLRDKELQRMSMLETERAKSQLAALQAQINPHFLFNSFNTLSTIIEEDPPLAVEYVEKMSDFFRSMLALRDLEFISVDEEINLVRNYSYLLEKRFGQAIKLSIELPKHFYQLFLIPLTLQILMENAVKHNIVSKTKPLTINIFSQDNKYLVMVNNRQPKHEQTASTGFGLTSLIKRYELIKENIIIENKEESFTVKIPTIQKIQS